MTLFLVVFAFANPGSGAGRIFPDEKTVMEPMFRARGDNHVLAGAATRRVIRWDWHLPAVENAWFSEVSAPIALTPVSAQQFPWGIDLRKTAP